MSTKTIGVVGRGSGWQKVGIELGSFVFYPNSSQPGMFQTFADSSFAHLTNFEVNVQNYRQVSRPLGWCGIDVRRSGTEFIQLQWPRQKRFFRHDNKTKS